jgi:hypothetical protein
LALLRMVCRIRLHIIHVMDSSELLTAVTTNSVANAHNIISQH